MPFILKIVKPSDLFAAMHKNILYTAMCVVKLMSWMRARIELLDFSCNQNVHLNSFINAVVQVLGLFKSKRNTIVYKRNRDLLIQKFVNIVLRVASPVA